MIDRILNLRLALFATLLLACACGDSEARTGSDRDAAARPESLVSGALVDSPIAEHRVELLDLAFEAASSFPIDPHIKNRSRAQEAVIVTCFDLDQPQRARRYIDRVDNWRKGAALADYAHECWKKGDRAAAKSALQEAVEIARNSGKGATSQAWRASRILAKVARVHLLMGNEDEASKIASSVIPAETGPLDAAVVDGMEAARFEQAIGEIDSILATGDLDHVRNALASCVRMYERFHEDQDKRLILEERVRHGYGKLPPQVRITLLMDLARCCLRKEDVNKARELVVAARSLLDGTQWLPQHQIPLQCQLAVLRDETGEPEIARKQVDDALRLYEQKHETVYDIYRAGLLRPIAEALVALGDAPRALTVYKRAASAGMENPNGRPRCDDLVATCCSLARNGLTPDDELRASLLKIREALGHPW